MVCSNGLVYSKRKRLGRRNSKRPLEVLLRATVSPVRLGEVTTWVKLACALLTSRRNCSRSFRPSAWAAKVVSANAAVVMSFLIMSGRTRLLSQGCTVGSFATRRHQNVALPARCERTDQARVFHVFQQAGRAVVADLELALHVGNAGLAVLEHDFHRLVVQRVLFAVAATTVPEHVGALAIARGAFQHTVDVIGLTALLFQIGHHTVHLVVADESAMHADRETGAGRHVQHVAHAEQALGPHLVEDGAA